jgi:hypothetical protein
MHKAIRSYSLHNLQIFPLGYLYVLYFTLVKSKLKYASVVWNCIMSTDANKLERIQQMIASVCFYRLFPHVPCSYTFALEKLSRHSLRTRRHHLDALFVVVHLYRDSSLLENIRLRVPTRHVSDLSTFSVCPSNKHRTSARCAYTVNVMGKYLDIFAIGAVYPYHIL